MKTHVLTPHKNRLSETVLLWGHNMFSFSENFFLENYQIKLGIEDNSEIIFFSLNENPCCDPS